MQGLSHDPKTLTVTPSFLVSVRLLYLGTLYTQVSSHAFQYSRSSAERVNTRIHYLERTTSQLTIRVLSIIPCARVG